MAADGCSVQSVGGPEPSKIAGPVAPEQRTDVDGIVQGSGHDAAGGRQASGVAGSGESGSSGLARAREAPLSESGAVARDLRALDWQIRTPSPPGVERSEKRSRRKQTNKENVMQKPKLVYATFIRTTPKKLW